MYQRGDANGDGTVDAYDADWIVQYIISNITLDEIQALNAASVHHNGASGDVVNIGDASFIAQYISSQRDCYFESVGKSDSFPEIKDGVVTVETGKPELTEKKQLLVPVIVRGVPEDSAGLSAYALSISYDPKTVDIIEVLPGKGAFTGKPVYNILKEKGEIRIAGIHPALLGATGDVIVAYLVISADGFSSTTPEFTIRVIDLADGAGESIIVKEK